jgi:hypothetical protein
MKGTKEGIYMAEPKQEIVRRIEPNALLQTALEKGSSVETLERLLALAKDVRAEQAREAFNRALADFQRDCPPITKSKTAKIATRTGGSYSYSYTPLEDIIEKIVPVMAPLGLSVSYRMGGTKDSVHAVAIITHELGHFKESGEVHMPVVAGAVGVNPAQCVGIAATYARRYALLAVTGISPQGEDTDATPPEAEEQPRTAEQPSPNFQANHEALKNENRQPQQPAQQDASLISVPQQRRLYAIAKQAGWADDELKKTLLGNFGYKSSKEIPKAHYETITLFFQGGGKPPDTEKSTAPAPPGPITDEDIGF